MFKQNPAFDATQPVSADTPWPTPGTLWERAVFGLLRTLADCASLDNAIADAVMALRSCRGKILICGNGGSAAQAQHFAAELVVRFERNRAAIPAISLTTDTSVITAAGNDFGYHDVFRRQVEALALPDDLLVAISTSGKSANVYTACQEALGRGCKVIALTGRNGMFNCVPTIELRVPSSDVARIQEVHALIIHAFCEGIEAD